MRKMLLALAALGAASVAWGQSLTLEKGLVVCRNKEALETMKEAGGYDKLPEFLIGTACFKLATDLPGRIASEERGVLEVAPRQRRSIGQPTHLWFERPIPDESRG